MLRKMLKTINSRLNERGQEVLDPTPMAIPVGFAKPESLEARMARAVRLASLHAANQGFETIEEAEDFDTGEDDYVPYSEHEVVYDEGLKKEVSKREKIQLDRDRAHFDAYVKANPPKRKKKVDPDPSDDSSKKEPR